MATTSAPNRVVTAGPPHRGPRRRWWMLAIVAVLCVVVGLLAQHVASGGGSSRPGGPGSPSPASIPAPLELGMATADEELATKEVAGVPRGFPQTVDGAVEAWTGAIAFARTLGANWPPTERTELYSELGYQAYPDLGSSVAKIQRYAHLNADGQPVSGEPGDRFYDDCLPQYGMYNTQQIAPNESHPVSVLVSVWMPCIQGIGSPSHIDNLRVWWDWYPSRMVWSGGDWRYSSTETPTNTNAPAPKDELRPNVSVAERAELVSGTPRGFWKLFRGYSEAWPTDLLGPELRPESGEATK